MTYQIIHKCENCGHKEEGGLQVCPPPGWYTIRVTDESCDCCWTSVVCSNCLPIKHKTGLNALLDWLKRYLRK